MNPWWADLSQTIEQTFNQSGFEVNTDFHGHYITKNQLHADPIVFNTATKTKEKLKPGFFTVEPHCIIGIGDYTLEEIKSNIKNLGKLYVRSILEDDQFSCKANRNTIFEERMYHLSEIGLLTRVL